MKIDECDKCGKITYIEMHHVLPKSTFGENDEKVKLFALVGVFSPTSIAMKSYLCERFLRNVR